MIAIPPKRFDKRIDTFLTPLGLPVQAHGRQDAPVKAVGAMLRKS